VPADIANKNVTDAVGEEAFPVELVPDKIVEKLVVLGGSVIGKKAVRAVVVDSVELNGVVR
jgi:hypothetical protein